MTTTQEREALAAAICRDVAELPDRISPDDWPEAMLVTATELREIVLDALAASPAAGVQALTEERLDELDTFSLNWMAPRGRESVRSYGRAVEAEVRDLSSTPAVVMSPEWVRNGIADFIADNWPDRKHTLAEIESGIRAVEIRPPLTAERFEVRVAGPDDVHNFDNELEAHRFANSVNAIYLADRLKHPDPADEVLCVATVHPKGAA